VLSLSTETREQPRKHGRGGRQSPPALTRPVSGPASGHRRSSPAVSACFLGQASGYLALIHIHSHGRSPIPPGGQQGLSLGRNCSPTSSMASDRPRQGPPPHTDYNSSAMQNCGRAIAQAGEVYGAVRRRFTPFHQAPTPSQTPLPPPAYDAYCRTGTTAMALRAIGENGLRMLSLSLGPCWPEHKCQFVA
jgi:hypothetical protein